MLRDDFRLMPIDTKVSEGDTAVLKCLPPRGNPRPVVRWTRNGDPVVVDGERVAVSEGGNLVIRDASARTDDGGEYVCQAINIVGSRDSEPATLQVQGEKEMMHGKGCVNPTLASSRNLTSELSYVRTVLHLSLVVLNSRSKSI